MSYNITAFNINEIKDLRTREIPRGYQECTWVGDPDDCVMKYEFDGESCFVEGRSNFVGQFFMITDIGWRGEFSGRQYHDWLIPFLKTTNGKLNAIVVWEGGDTIERLEVNDGMVKESAIR